MILVYVLYQINNDDTRYLIGIFSTAEKAYQEYRNMPDKKAYHDYDVISVPIDSIFNHFESMRL